MSRERKQIRQAFVSIVTDSKTKAGTNVAENMIDADWYEELPAISVNTLDENGELFEDFESNKRVLQVRIECKVSGRSSSEASSELDSLMEEVEAAIGYKIITDKDFRCLFNRPETINVTMKLEENGKQIIAAGILTYNVTYYKKYSEVGPKTDDLLRVDTDFQVGDSGLENEDLFDIPT